MQFYPQGKVGKFKFFVVGMREDRIETGVEGNGFVDGDSGDFGDCFGTLAKGSPFAHFWILRNFVRGIMVAPWGFEPQLPG